MISAEVVISLQEESFIGNPYINTGLVVVLAFQHAILVICLYDNLW